MSHDPVTAIVSVIEQRLAGRTRPLAVALDGGSGAGKSTIAAAVAQRLAATVIPCDDFFQASITNEEWDACTPEQRCRRCIDWHRLRDEALMPLMIGQPARYHPFSFSTGTGLKEDPVELKPAAVLLLDGIYSALPDWSDLVELTVLVEVDPELRRQRHNRREGSGDEEWHARWDPAEDYYFTFLRPPSTYDWVVRNEREAEEEAERHS